MADEAWGKVLEKPSVVQWRAERSGRMTWEQFEGQINNPIMEADTLRDVIESERGDVYHPGMKASCAHDDWKAYFKSLDLSVTEAESWLPEQMRVARGHMYTQEFCVMSLTLITNPWPEDCSTESPEPLPETPKLHSSKNGDVPVEPSTKLKPN